MPFSNYADTASLLARIEALELALYGKLTNLSPDQFLGSGSGGGVAVPIPQSNFVATLGNKSIGGIVNFTNTTASTSTTTGCATFGGGIGVASDVRCESLFYSAGGLVITATNPDELGTGYGFIRHSSGPVLFYVGTASPFFFKNGNGSAGNLVSINQDGTIIYHQAIPTGSGTSCVFSGGKIIALSSSREFKEKIRPLEVRADILDLIDPVTFSYKGQTEKTTHGFIAEEVAEVDPNLVIFENGKPYSIQASEMVAVLWREVQQLKKKLIEK